MRTPRQNPSCYMCDAPSVGKENVPPRGMFPENSIYMKNLITVPSCKLHNGDKSEDDALVRWYLTSTHGNNELALEVMRSALARLNTRPALFPTYLDGVRAWRDTPGWTTMVYNVHLERFEASIKAMVRALYYHESKFSKKLLDELTVVWTAMKERKKLTEPEHYDLLRAWSDTLGPVDRGANPRVFQYRFDHPDDTGKMCRLRFYEGQEIYVLWPMNNQDEHRA